MCGLMHFICSFLVANDASSDDATVLEASSPQLSPAESISLLQKLAVRHRLTDRALEDVLSTIRVHLPVSVQIPCHLRSLYMFRQYASTSSVAATALPHTTTHHVCGNCWDITDSKGCCREECQGCSPVQFYELSLAQQLQEFFKGIITGCGILYDCSMQMQIVLSDEQFTRLLLESHCGQRNEGDNLLSDIPDGRAYKSAVLPGSEKTINISMAMNIDGTPCFKGSKLSLWPVYLRINELPASIR